MFHIGHGLVMRDDMHQDMVFLVTEYMRFLATPESGKKAFFQVVLRQLNRRFPGHYATSSKEFRGYILDFALVALWPWRTMLVVTNPLSYGGRYSLVPFNEIRLEALTSKFPTLIFI